MKRNLYRHYLIRIYAVLYLPKLVLQCISRKYFDIYKVTLLKMTNTPGGWHHLIAFDNMITIHCLRVKFLRLNLKDSLK